MNLEGVWGVGCTDSCCCFDTPWCLCVLFFLSDPAFQNFLPDRSSWGFPRQPNIAQTLPLTDRLGLSPTLYSGAEKFSRGSHRRVWKEIWFSATTVNSSGFEWRPFSQETYKFKSDSNYRVWFFILKLTVPKIFEDSQTRAVTYNFAEFVRRGEPYATIYNSITLPFFTKQAENWSKQMRKICLCNTL